MDIQRCDSGIGKATAKRINQQRAILYMYGKKDRMQDSVEMKKAHKVSPTLGEHKA